MLVLLGHKVRKETKVIKGTREIKVILDIREFRELEVLLVL